MQKLTEHLFNGKSKKNSEIKILNIGCGNSTMSEDMYDDGFTQNYNVDIS
jgi:2-polyprenyl-3-methyl-5-hydroxy-6-metoxy-1,4-benzoquinol methylase